MWIELDRVPSRNRGSAWDKGRLFSFVAPSPLFLSSSKSRGGWSEGREESGATVVNSAAKREDFSASSNL